MKTNIDSYIDTFNALDTSSANTHYWSANRRLGEEELAECYEGDAVAARIVDRIVDDAIRAEWDLAGTDTAYDWQAIKSAVDDLGAIPLIGDAWRWARLQGGGVLILAVDDGRPFNEPLDMAYKGLRLRGLSALDSTQIKPVAPDAKLGSEAWRNPTAYRISEPGVSDALIHSSRVIRFDGYRVPSSRLAKSQNPGWGPSVLQRCWGSLADYRKAQELMTSALSRASVIALMIEGWKETALAGTEEQEKLRTLLREFWRGLNVHQLAVLDTKDQLVEVKRSVEGFPAIVKEKVAALVMDSDTTSQIITGTQTSTGLNSDTKGEWRSWYDRVTVERRVRVEPPLNRILEIEFAGRRNRNETVPAQWTIRWEPLEREAQDDTADRIQKWSGSLGTLIERGVITAPEARQTLIDQGLLDQTELDAAADIDPAAPPAPVEVAP